MSCSTPLAPHPTKRQLRARAIEVERRKSSLYCIRAERRPLWDPKVRLWRWTDHPGLGEPKPASYLPTGIYQRLKRSEFATADEANRAAEHAARSWATSRRHELYEMRWRSPEIRRAFAEGTLINLGYLDETAITVSATTHDDES